MPSLVEAGRILDQEWGPRVGSAAFAIRHACVFSDRRKSVYPLSGFGSLISTLRVTPAAAISHGVARSEATTADDDAGLLATTPSHIAKWHHFGTGADLSKACPFL
jgi:hypothetical protein